MPITPDLMKLYPGGSIRSPEWRAIVHRIRVVRARNLCEACGVRHKAWGYRDRAGVFHPTSFQLLKSFGWKKGQKPPFYIELGDGRTAKIIRIVVTVAHKNHDVTDNDDENLAAWCQKDHNAHDAPQRRKNARRTLRRRYADRDLFEDLQGARP